MPESTPIVPDQRAVVASELARQLREAARVIRHWGGELRYHPLTGEQPKAPEVFLGALAAVESVARALQQGAGERSLDEAALESAAAGVGANDAAAVRAGHAALNERTQTVAAALQVLRATLSDAGQASLDAPYGSGAPRRHHPGALSTIVAARVEDLVLALEAVTILKANIGRRLRAT
jgi:hypothetical protein